MTERLYYTDAALRTFDATITALLPGEGGTHVLLDRTAFYPTSGGQPFDTGTLGGAPVIDVIDREDGEIAHVIRDSADLVVGARVSGVIDDGRRFDHMQQHTGQHMLSAAFDRLLGVRTVSFHLGATSATIDLAREVTRQEIDRAAAAANTVVWEDRPVTIRFADASDAAAQGLRKASARTGELRLVEIEDFDLSACGGTHVARTGAIGVIAIAGWERFKGATRLTFVCGGRALGAYGALRDVVSSATRLISVAPHELEGAIVRLQTEAKAQTRALSAAQAELASFRAAALVAAAELAGACRVVVHTEATGDANILKILAASIVRAPDLVAIVIGTSAGDGTPCPVVAARAGGVEFDAGVWLRTATAALGGRGGGRPELAQGGIAATPEAIIAYARGSFGLGDAARPLPQS